MRTHVVGSNEHHLTFAAWFRRRLSARLSGDCATLVAGGRFTRNGKPLVDPEVRLAAGDVIVDREDEELPATTRSGLRILYEDDDLLVIDKPAGMLSHKEPGHPGPDVIGELGRRRDVRGYAPGNRLDFHTAGLMILTRHAAAAATLSQATADGAIAKRYLAVVGGSFTVAGGVLEAHLEKDESRSVVTVTETPSPTSKPITTRYRVLAVQGPLSLLEVEPVTGRTHQIRAHLAFVGHPIVGDPLYGNPVLNRRYGRKTQALCAYELAFAFPAPDHPWHRLDGRRFQRKDVEFLDAFGFPRP